MNISMWIGVIAVIAVPPPAETTQMYHKSRVIPCNPVLVGLITKRNLAQCTHGNTRIDGYLSQSRARANGAPPTAHVKSDRTMATFSSSHSTRRRRPRRGANGTGGGWVTMVAVAVTILVGCATVARAQGTTCRGPRTKSAIRTMMLEGYEKYNPPESDGASALNVSVTATLKVLESVSAPTGSFRALMQTRFEWNDPRLVFNSTSKNNGCYPRRIVSYPSTILDDIWTPNYYFANQVDSFGTPSRFVEITQNGKVTVLTTEGIEANCDFKFTKMPFDRQTCNIRLGFLHPQDEVVIESPSDGASALRLPRGGQLGGTLEWTIVSATSNHGVTPAPPHGSFVEFEFEMKRASSYWVTFTLVPAVFLVMLSYGTFYVQRTATPARAAFCFVCYLTVINLTNGALAALPRLGPSDALLLALLSASEYFCACTILLVVVANYFLHIELRVNAALKEVERLAIEGEPVGDVQAYVKARCGRAGIFLIKKNGHMSLSDQHVDIAARYIFPVAYAITIGTIFSARD